MTFLVIHKKLCHSSIQNFQMTFFSRFTLCFLLLHTCSFISSQLQEPLFITAHFVHHRTLEQALPWTHGPKLLVQLLK